MNRQPRWPAGQPAQPAIETTARLNIKKRRLVSFTRYNSEVGLLGGTSLVRDSIGEIELYIACAIDWDSQVKLEDVVLERDEPIGV